MATVVSSISKLVHNDQIVGCRIRNDGKYYDASLESVQKLGYDLRAVEKTISLKSVAGDLLSKGEIVSGQRVENFSNNTDVLTNLLFLFELPKLDLTTVMGSV